jgi:uncharacterized protein DUF3997
MVMICLSGCSGFAVNDKIIGNYSLVGVDGVEQSCVCYFEPTDSNHGCFPVITQTVYSVGFNNKFIIAQQHPDNNRKINNYFILPVNYTKKRWGDNFGLVGPLTFQQFNEKRKELRIPDSLKFTIINDDLK